MSVKLLLKNGYLFNPGGSHFLKRDILIENGLVGRIGNLHGVYTGCQVIDCCGKLMVPGLIDMHVHSRTPGQEHKETLTTLSMAALAGGFTTVVCMANTSPVIDDPDILHQLLVRAERESLVDLCQVSAATQRLEGLESVDFRKMLANGAIAFSDDGKGLQNPDLSLEVMMKCADLKKSLLLHCQDDRFDTYDKRSEYHSISLVLKIAEQFQIPVHIQHVSCAESVQLIREAKARGVKVTCETAPHYIALTQWDFKRIGVNAKMNPPLRGKADRAAVIQGLVDGTIDVIATDHAPHTDEEKNSDNPPFGIIGLETAIPVLFSSLANHLTPLEIISKMTINPARILGLEKKGLIKEGWPADITVIDPTRRKVLKAENLKSRSHNSPWLGKRMQGWPVITIRHGKIMMMNGEIIIE
jgi:dihydroorotase